MHIGSKKRKIDRKKQREGEELMKKGGLIFIQIIVIIIPYL